jgi:hypothetical protein
MRTTVRKLRKAQPAMKADLYAALGISVTYDPAANTAILEATPEKAVGFRACRRGDLNPHALAGTSPSS